MGLYNNYMSILTVESGNVTVETDGSLDWGQMTYIEAFKNVRCNVQQKNKNELETKYGKPELVGMINIFHRCTGLIDYVPIADVEEIREHTGLRIITAANPRKAISNFESMKRSEYDIYTVCGHLQQIRGSGTRARQFYILKCKKSNRFEL